MREFLKSTIKDKQLPVQILFVFAAFFIMVLLSSILGGRIIDRNVELYGKEVVATAGEMIDAYFDEYELMLGNVAFSIAQLNQLNANTDDMRAALTEWTERTIESSDRYRDFTGFYGTIHGVFMDGTGWDPMNPDSEDYVPDYSPRSRPWYIGAMEAWGDTHITDPYLDADTGEFVMTLSKVLFNIEGEFYGILAMDIFLNDVMDLINSLKLLDSGYGVLLDSERKIIVTSNQDRVGIYFDDIDEGHAQIGRALDTVGGIVHSNVISDGEEYVVFFKQLHNGWYVGVASLRVNYYSDSHRMTFYLSVVGLLLALPLCAVLIVLHIKKARADKASELKTSFLANMSHDIRTPMNAIIGMTELLQNEPLDEQQMGYVKDIHNSSQTLLAIINDILDLSKIEAGKIELHPTDYDFMSFLDNVVSMFTVVTEGKGLDFRYEKSGDLPECLYGDDIRLWQVLTNLCGNAIKFTSRGYISLYVSVYENDIAFVIKDTGLGIRKEDLSKLFNPFEQFDMQNNRKIIGTGLGLPISKNFVEMMGGTMKVDSEYGKGTTFLFTIPKVVGNPANINRDKASEEIKSFTAPDARVLIVDDNEVNLKVASGLLNKLYKIKTTTVTSGIDAIYLVQEDDFDIIFMDHMMPGMDGMQTVSEIRKMGSRFKKLKIIALSANAIAGIKEMFITGGFDSFISKPIDVSELHTLLLEYLPPEKIRPMQIDKHYKSDEHDKHDTGSQDTHKDSEPEVPAHAYEDREAHDNDNTIIKDVTDMETATTTAAKNTVLIIDDEEMNLRILKSFLSEDYDVTTAAGGAEGLEKALADPPDLILLDVLMPEMDGYQVLEALKKDDRTWRIPVIFITGLDSKEDEEKGLSMNAADYISKPFSVGIVRLRVKNQIQIVNQIRTIESLSLIDQLTGIPNRRNLDNRFKMEWTRALREHQPITLMMMDIDKFKLFNDTYGHLVGDDVLKLVAASFEQSLKRKSDFAARFGGEEFSVLLPNTSVKAGVDIAESIRRGVEELVIPCGDGKTTKVTLSIGVHTFTPTQDETITAMIEKADQALYEAKESGRNRVCVFGSEYKEGTSPDAAASASAAAAATGDAAGNGKSGDVTPAAGQDTYSTMTLSEKLEAIAHIEGIDVKAGLSHFSNLDDIYIETVEFFAERLPVVTADMDKAIADGDIKAFTISVHSMKSMLSTVGAVELSQMAEALEAAGKAGDEVKCRGDYPVLHQKLRELQTNMKFMEA